MAKKKKDKKNSNLNDMYSPKQVLRCFTKSTCRKIDGHLENVDTDDLINGLYFSYKGEDEDIKYMLKQYEKQLILNKVNNDEFHKGLHVFFSDMSKHIKENKLYEKFYHLAHITYIEMCKKKVNDKIADAYFDLFIQQNTYFFTTERVVYGIGKNEIFTIPEVGTNLTKINFEIERAVRLRKDGDEIFRIFKKYGYKNIKNKYEIYNIVTYDQVVNNMLFQMTYFINDETKFLLPTSFRNGSDTSFCTNYLFYNDNTINEIKERLTRRQHLLPIQGITAKYENCKDIEEVFFLEQIKDDIVHLLFKIKFKDDTYTLGFYDTYNKVYFDIWKDSSHSDIISKPIENLILQTYIDLTCNLDLEEKEEFCGFTYADELHFFDIVGLELPRVKYEIKLQSHDENNMVSERTRNFNKSHYVQELKNVNSFLRKLPVDANASDEAIEFAKRLGIELPNGYTFVREFKKKVYKKEE